MSSTLLDVLGQGPADSKALIVGSDGPQFTRAQIHQAQIHQDSKALIVGSDGPQFTRAQIHQAAVQLALTLRHSGVGVGDVVTIVEANTVENVVAFLGVTYARSVAAPLNQNYTREEFSFYMEDSGSSLILTGPNGNAAAEAAAQTPVLSIELKPAAGEGKNTNASPTLDIQLRSNSGSTNFTLKSDVSAKERTLSLEDPPRPEDEALFLHTSGTTSRPKGVPLTHANLAASLKNIKETYEFTPEDVSLLVMPLFHVHGLMAGLLAPLFAGATVVFPAGGRFSAATFWQDAVTHHVTFYTAVPTIHQILVARAEKDYPKDSPPPLRVIRSCSASLAPATLHQLEQLFHAPVLEAYAMTEASHQMTSNPLPSKGPHKPGTVGKAQGSVEVAILGPEPDFKHLQPGEIGEVCIRGPNVTTGYRNNPTANKDSFVLGGWFRTGDMGMLDEEGYLKLTGRIKELINRGGEKISPLEVDAALLSCEEVGEAVSFGAPDEKYGEVVAAAVVLSESGKKRQEESGLGEKDMAEIVKKHVTAKLAAFKVPVQVFITNELPKTATGKIQRRMMVEAFITGNKTASSPNNEEGKAGKEKSGTAAFPENGFFLVARALQRLGVRYMFGVVGIPVTQLASAAQACGIRFIGCRNEQAAGYAASAVGFLTGSPGVLLTVSGPGVVHGLAGLSNAQVNCWPLLMISGSCESSEIGKGSFQELDQVKAVQDYVKYAKRAWKVEEIPTIIEEAFKTAVSGRPGAAYIDLPSDVLMSPLHTTSIDDLMNKIPELPISEKRPAETPAAGAAASGIQAAAALLKGAQRPLVVIGKGAAFSQAENALLKLIEGWGVPFLATSMGRGVVPDDHRHCANAARSMALSQADVAVIFGGRLNWQLHFGEPQKWSQDVKFILVDPEPSPRDADLAAVVLRGDAGAVAGKLLAEIPPAVNSLSAPCAEWAAALMAKSLGATTKLEEKLSATAHPLNYLTTLRVIRDELHRLPVPPIVISEGANTMDNARLILGPVVQPRTRLDAGTWGTMGVGPGYAMAAAVTSSNRNVVAVEGDSAFGFSALEVETACRYQLPIVFVVMNNGGVYGGDRRERELAELATAGLAKVGVPNDPAPTSFVPGARYDMLATAFGGVGVKVSDAEGLQKALREALESKKTTVIDVEIDPMAGVESGNVHAFNAPKQQGG